jgi:1-acyl-sn-glycerol-3-phosphate acyltransferase
MKPKFKMLSHEEEAALTREELIKYYQQKRAYFRKCRVNTFDIVLAKIFRRFILRKARELVTNEIIYLNDIEAPTEGGYIIAPNHWGAGDLPLMIIAFEKEMFFPLAAIDANFDLTTKILFKLLAATKVDRTSNRSKQWASDYQSRLGARGYNLAYWGEATWNRTASKPVHHLWPGAVIASKNTGLPIIPIATQEINGKIYIKSAKPYIVNPWDDVEEKSKEIRDIIAEMVFEMWGMFNEIPNTISRNEAIAYHQERLANIKDPAYVNPEYEQQFIFRLKNPYSPTGERELNYDEAFAHLQDIEITKDNAFLLRPD